MKRYPAYKDSRVEWIGEVPEHWEILRTKDICQFSNGYAYKSSEWAENGLPVIRMSNISEIGKLKITEDNIKFISTESGEKTKSFLIQKEDVLIAMTDMSSKMGILGKTIIFDQDGEYYLNQRVGRIRIYKDKIELGFFHYTSNSDALRHQIKSDVYPNVQYNASTETIRNCRLPYPPIAEQRFIQKHLDHKTQLIDTLIEKKQKQIELLQEKRTAIINQAVTKGLNPNAKMKDSGIEWLGEVPEPWAIKQLKHLSTTGLKNGVFKKKDKFGSGTKLINVIDLYQEDHKIKFDQLGRVELDETEIKKYEVFQGDIFFVRSSLKLEGVGVSVCIDQVPEPAVYECHVVCMKPNTDKVDYRFLINFLNSFHVRHRLVSLAETVTMATLSQPKISSLEVLVPPVTEQVRIINHIEKTNSFVFRMVKNIEASIEKLKEYRTTLISEVVTGKIDVRDEAIP